MIFDRMAPHYGPRQDFGARHQFVADPGMSDMGGGMGRVRRPMPTGGNAAPQGGFTTGGNTPPVVGGGFQTGGPSQPMQVPQFNTGGPGQQFRVPSFMTGGNTPPMMQQAFGLQTGGQLPPMQSQWMTGGNMSPQSSLSRWFNTFRQGAYR